MVFLKSEAEIGRMRQAGRAAAELLDYLETHLSAGISTLEIDELSRIWIEKHGLRSATLNYKGFPGHLCTSVNHIVCHGIPSTQVILKEGDIINLDITLIVAGYHGDVSRTFIIGTAPRSVQELVSRTQNAMMQGIQAIAPGKPISVIGNAIAAYIKKFRYGIVIALCGHGIGKNFHEDPLVLHHKQRRKGIILQPGMTFTVEPMINEGSARVYTGDDGWSVYTKDGKLSAQFEHTIAVREDGFEILTLS